MVSRLDTEGWRRGISRVHVKRIRAVCRLRRRLDTNLPTWCTVRTSAPTVVGLGGRNIHTECVGLKDRFRWIGKHQRLALALVDFEVGVQKSPIVHVGQDFSLPRADDQKMSPCWNHGPGRDFKLVHVPRVVRKKIPSQIHVRRRRVEKLDKILVVPSYAQGVIAARKFVHHHLRRPHMASHPDAKRRQNPGHARAAFGEMVHQCRRFQFPKPAETAGPQR